MAKLRKMMGDINAPEIISLMRLIETQNGKTLGNWAVDYVENHVFPIYRNAYPEDKKVSETLAFAKEYLDGNISLKEIKALIKEVTQIARDASDNPAAQAAARAVSTACSVVYLPTSALGFTFYAAAAIVYDRAGLAEKQEVYDVLAEGVFREILASLQEAAVPDEPNPVKIKWNC